MSHAVKPPQALVPYIALQLRSHTSLLHLHFSKSSFLIDIRTTTDIIVRPNRLKKDEGLVLHLLIHIHDRIRILVTNYVTHRNILDSSHFQARRYQLPSCLFPNIIYLFSSFFVSSKHIQIAAMSDRSTPGATVTKY